MVLVFHGTLLSKRRTKEFINLDKLNIVVVSTRMTTKNMEERKGRETSVNKI